jgi:hypothetical protein
VHAVADGRCGDAGCRAERVPDDVTLLAHVDDGRARERADVVRLSATRRVERRAVQRDRALAGVDDGGVELREVRVAQVEEVGQ